MMPAATTPMPTAAAVAAAAVTAKINAMDLAVQVHAHRICLAALICNG